MSTPRSISLLNCDACVHSPDKVALNEDLISIEKKMVKLTLNPTESNIGKSPLSCDARVHHPGRVALSDKNTLVQHSVKKRYTKIITSPNCFNKVKEYVKIPPVLTPELNKLKQNIKNLPIQSNNMNMGHFCVNCGHKLFIFPFECPHENHQKIKVSIGI